MTRDAPAKGGPLLSYAAVGSAIAPLVWMISAGDSRLSAAYLQRLVNFSGGRCDSKNIICLHIPLCLYIH